MHPGLCAWGAIIPRTLAVVARAPSGLKATQTANNIGRKTMKLAGQVAIVTGAGRNIGEETAKLFASEGATVAVVDMDRARADKVTAAINGEGGRARTYLCDVAQEEQIVATVN